MAAQGFHCINHILPTLGYVSTNYVQSDLRQFDLLVDYYYSDNAKPGLKKLKAFVESDQSKFKDIADLTEILNKEDFEKNTELALKRNFRIVEYKINIKCLTKNHPRTS